MGKPSIYSIMPWPFTAAGALLIVVGVVSFGAGETTQGVFGFIAGSILLVYGVSGLLAIFSKPTRTK